MKRIITLISFAFVLILSVNTKLLAQTTKTINIVVEAYDGDNMDKCTATVQLWVGSDWVDYRSSSLFDGSSLTFRVSLPINAAFRVKVEAKRGSIHNINYSKKYFVTNVSGVRLLIDFYIARSNYVLIE